MQREMYYMYINFMVFIYFITSLFITYILIANIFDQIYIIYLFVLFWKYIIQKHIGMNIQGHNNLIFSSHLENTKLSF